MEAQQVADVLLVLDDEERPFQRHVVGLSARRMTGR
jgi:hypothetical protein